MRGCACAALKPRELLCYLLSLLTPHYIKITLKTRRYSHSPKPRLHSTLHNRRLIYGRPVSLRVCRSTAEPQMPHPRAQPASVRRLCGEKKGGITRVWRLRPHWDIILRSTQIQMAHRMLGIATNRRFGSRDDISQVEYMNCCTSHLVLVLGKTFLTFVDVLAKA